MEKKHAEALESGETGILDFGAYLTENHSEERDKQGKFMRSGAGEIDAEKQREINAGN